MANAGVLEAILRLRNDLSPQLQNAAKDLKRTGQSMARTGMRMSAMVTAPIVGIGAAAVKMAVDAEESANKFEVVMGDAASGLREEFQQLAEFMPLTLSEMEALTAGIQDMLVPMGVARDTGAEMSLEILKLTGDLASFNNVAQADVLNAYKSALAGMSRPMRQFGVDVSQARLEQIALAEGLMQAGGEMSNTARAQAILIAVTQDSTDALGDQERTVTSTSNQMRLLWADVRQLGEEIGQTLIPAVRPLIERAREAVRWFRDLDQGTKEWILTIGAVAAAVGPVLVVLGSLLSALGSIAGAVASGGLLASGLSGLIALLSGPVGVAAAVGIAAAAIGNFIGKTAGPALEEWIAGTKESLAELQEGITNLNDTVGTLGLAIADRFRESMPQITQAISDGVAAGKDMNTILGELTTKFEAGTEEGDALRAAMVEIGGEMNAASREAAALERAQEEAARAAREHTAAIVRQVDAWRENLEMMNRWREHALKETRAEVDQFIDRMGVFNDFVTDARVPVEALGGPQGMEGLIAPTDSAAESFRRHQAATRDSTEALSGFFSIIRTGKDWLDSLIGSVLNLVGSLIGGNGLGAALKQTMGGIAGMFSGQGGGGLGGLWEGIKGMFGGGGGMPGAFDASGMLGGGGGFLSGIMGSISSIFGGPIGGLAMKGIAELGKKIWGGLKSLFGGPSEEELLGRDIVHQFEADIASVLDQTQLAEAGGESWKKTVIGLRDAFLILGKSEDEALKAAERLWASSKEGSEASQAVVAELGPVFQEVMARMQETGMSFTELKNSVTQDVKETAEKTKSAVDDSIKAAQNKLLSLTHQLEGATGDEAEAIRKAIHVQQQEIARLIQDAADDTASKWSDVVKGLPESMRRAVDDVNGELRKISIPDFNFRIGSGGGEDFHQVPHLQHGGIVTAPTLAMVGESGPEAVVPLDRGSGKQVMELQLVGGSGTQQAAFRALATLVNRADVEVRTTRRG